MSHKTYQRIGCGLGVLAAAALLGSNNPAHAQAKKPNILFIMGDDIGWMQPSCYHRGLMVGETPNIDRLANEGGIFMHYYAEQSCTAGRTAFFTGMHPMRAGMLMPELPGAISYLRPGTPALASSCSTSATAPVSSARTTSAIIPIRCRPRTASRNSGATSTISMRCKGSASRTSTSSPTDAGRRAADEDDSDSRHSRNARRDRLPKTASAWLSHGRSFG